MTSLRVGIFILLSNLFASLFASTSINLKIPSNVTVNTDSLNNFPNTKDLTDLQLLKRDQLRKKWFSCRANAIKLLKKEKIFKHWVWNIYWNCTVENAFSKNLRLKTVLKRLQEFPFSKNTAAYNFQRHNIYELLQRVFQQSRFTKNKNSRRIFEWFEENHQKFTLAQRAEIYADYAQLLLRKSREEQAIGLLKKSVDLMDTPMAVKKLVQLEQLQFLSDQGIDYGAYLKENAKDSVESKSFYRLWKAGQYNGAMKVLIKIKDRDEVSALYQRVRKDLPKVFKSFSKSSREEFITHCKKIPGETVYAWADRLFWRYRYKDSYVLSDAAKTRISDTETKAKNYYLMGMVKYYYSEYEEAKSFLKLADTNFSMDSEMKPWALFRLGLLEMRLSKWSSATNYFDRILEQDIFRNFHLSAYYWKFVSLEKLGKKNDALNVANQLVKEFPITYFGLKLQEELNIQPDFLQEKKQVLQLEANDRKFKSWQNYKELLRLSFIEEAAEELSYLEFSEDPTEQLFYSYYLARSHKYYAAFERIGEVWDQKIGLSKDIVFTMYPKAFEKHVKKYAKKYKVDSNLIWGLMRQESAFRRKVTSSSNAIGLMQIIPSTARENARNIGIKKLKVPEDLYHPWKNIKIGIYYFSRLLKRFKGDERLAAASYNVGIGNVRRWFSLRCKSCKKGVRELAAIDKLKQNVDRLEDLWIEELPWQETRYYVKAVLRNKKMYEYLHLAAQKVSKN